MIYSLNDPKVVANPDAFIALNYPPVRILLYAHGELEKLMDYDLVATDSIKLFNLLHHASLSTGVIEVPTIAIDRENKLHFATIIAWTLEVTDTQPYQLRGYVVKADDTESLGYGFGQAAIKATRQ